MSAKDSFNWVTAYEGFAEKLLKYKDKQGKLFKAIVGIDDKDVLPDALKKAIGDKSCKEGDKSCREIDPFTVIGLFNRHWNDDTRKEIFKKLCEALEFTPSPTIEGFSGVPVPGHGKEVFSIVTESSEGGRAKILWELFQAAMDLAKASEPNEKQKESFKSSYNKALALNGVKWNLSMALFWISPNHYLTLDSNVQSFLSDARNVPEIIAKKVSKWAEPPQGADYLELIDMLKKEMKEGSFAENYGYSNFFELSAKAFEASQYSDVMDILKHNGQIILHGAPGTGKTYMANKIAQLISGDNGRVDKSTGEFVYDRIRSVQFHPGYDYSDFIVGLKPKLAPSGKDITFEWCEGIFKEIARKAKASLDDKAKKFNVEIDKKTVEKRNEDNTTSFDPDKFVLVIDEINRADLSNVFGEVFSLSEREYRYRYEREKDDDGNEKPNGKVKVVDHHVDLPSTEKGLDVHEKFAIPSNLYIIGTMNDIDRSVESIDFALRRRFAWYEVGANKTKNVILEQFDVKDQEKLKKAMIALNEEICKPDYRLGQSYELGAAYFAQLKLYKSNGGEYNNSAYKSLWNNHIKTILREYLRGQDEDERKMNKFETIFCKEVGIKSREAKENKSNKKTRENQEEI